MTDTGAIGDRIDALEIRLAYQDETIERLNAAVTAQWTLIDALKREVDRLTERVEQAAGGPSDPLSEKPPHY